jgi:hypothetical protein
MSQVLPNNLLLLADAHAGMALERFLELVFDGWNTATAPAAMPKKATRIASDSGIPCGVFARDAYNKTDRKKMAQAGKSAAELGLDRPKEHRIGRRDQPLLPLATLFMSQNYRVTKLQTY